MSCPECGSGQAVSKSEAWDAACEVPPKTARELENLRGIASAALKMIRHSPHPGDEETVVIGVPAELLNDLCRACGKDAFETE